MKQKRDYSKVSKRSNQTSERFDFMDDYINIVLELYYKGFTRDVVYEYLTSELKLPPTTANGVLDAAIRKTKDIFDLDKEYLLNLHIKRYEDISAYSSSIRVNNPGDIFELNKKFDSLITWLESLNQKERLLGFHTKTFKVKFKNYLKTKNTKKTRYDFSKLSIEELIKIKEFVSQNTEEKFMIRPRKEVPPQSIEVNEEIVIEDSALRKETEIKPKIKIVKNVVKKVNDVSEQKPLTIEEVKRKIIERSSGK